MRGNLNGAVNMRHAARSIPAYAGEPRRCRQSRRKCRVYPRVCGGTNGCLRWGYCPPGLSPRMRGNLVSPPTPPHPIRSIPAYAGEPRSMMRRTPAPAVYPRVCGGTYGRQSQTDRVTGLSPRMRGNRQLWDCRRSACRSIPAYAGEPAPACPAAHAGMVYPRVCGGTRMESLQVPAQPGLSPRMRGNRCRPPPHSASRGSIPAYAGEPGLIYAHPIGYEVYPRVCGGTARRGGRMTGKSGLSPRMRGNPPAAMGKGPALRSIPAYAGEPI